MINPNDIPDDQLDSLLAQLESLSIQTTLDYSCTNPVNGKTNVKQMAFHFSNKPVRVLLGGNRSGKTEGGTAEDVMHLTGDYPAYWPEECRFKGPTRGRIIVQDLARGAAVLEQKIWKWLPKNRVVSLKRSQTGALSTLHVRHRSGGVSVVEILSHEQDMMVFEGWSGHWAHFDEPPPREQYVATKRGLIDLRGRCWLTLTPLNQPWIYDEVINSDNQDIFSITIDMRDNPFLDPDAIDEFERTLTEDEKDARLHGKPRQLQGLVYKDFNPEVHVIDRSKVKIDPAWPTYFVTDPHDRKPHFGLWAKIDPFGTIYIVDEIMRKCTFKDYSGEVLVREAYAEPAINSGECIRILDPNKGNTPSAVTGLKLKDEFARYGLYFTANVNDDIATGHMAVSQRLAYNKNQPITDRNKPKIFWIRETTKECVRFMQRYTWDDFHGKAADSKGQKEKPIEKFKDFPDCVRYLVMSNPVFFTSDQSDPEPRAGGVTGYGPGGEETEGHFFSVRE